MGHKGGLGQTLSISLSVMFQQKTNILRTKLEIKPTVHIIFLFYS
jgi:hypothetical protein